MQNRRRNYELDRLHELLALIWDNDDDHVYSLLDFLTTRRVDTNASYPYTEYHRPGLERSEPQLPKASSYNILFFFQNRIAPHDAESSSATLWAELKYMDKRGWTPLHFAVARNNLNALALLLAYPYSETRTDIKDANDKTAFDIGYEIWKTKCSMASKMLLNKDKKLFDFAELAIGKEKIDAAIHRRRSIAIENKESEKTDFDFTYAAWMAKEQKSFARLCALLLTRNGLNEALLVCLDYRLKRKIMEKRDKIVAANRDNEESIPEILARATYGNTKDFVKQNYYEPLLNNVVISPFLAPVLELAKLWQLFNQRMHKTPLKIKIDEDSDDISRITLDLRRANWFVYGSNYSNRYQIYVAGKRADDEDTRKKLVRGCIVHELIHQTAMDIYRNGCNPYFKDDKKSEELFDIITQKLKEKYDRNPHALHKVFQAVFGYDKEKWHLELIVRPAQIMAQDGNYNAVEEQCPELMKYYKENFLNECQKRIQYIKLQFGITDFVAKLFKLPYEVPLIPEEPLIAEEEVAPINNSSEESAAPLNTGEITVGWGKLMPWAEAEYQAQFPSGEPILSASEEGGLSVDCELVLAYFDIPANENIGLNKLYLYLQADTLMYVAIGADGAILRQSIPNNELQNIEPIKNILRDPAKEKTLNEVDQVALFAITSKQGFNRDRSAVPKNVNRFLFNGGRNQVHARNPEEPLLNTNNASLYRC